AVESDSSRKVLWNSIESIHLIHTANDGTDVLVFKNNKDEKILLDVYGFKKKDLYSFLIGVKGFAPSLNVDPILESLQLSSLGQDQQESEGSGQSFTRLWSDTLGFHAGNTSFVPLAPGTALAGGRVKICRLAAAGGMAAIYLASLKDGRIAVVKEAVIPASNDAKMTSKALELFKREAGFLGELKHPQIARLYDYFVEKNRHYMIIEYLEGTNLRQLVDEGGPLSPSIAIEYILQLTKIIAFLHERKPAIIHRDISPDNVIASKDFSIKLIDFGAANTFVGTATRTLVGKQAYMSPEQCKGRSTPLSDLYSIGSTLSFLLTGVDPVPLITSRPCQVKEGIEPGLEEIIERLTARDPDHRPQ
ncbi:MAG: serine/threonine protein kinase, partial [Candidatus Obscuribacterales bacterium]|nr:serine/threonine protein kinase [Candidatus Obscuribacterales bacterium]